MDKWVCIEVKCIVAVWDFTVARQFRCLPNVHMTVVREIDNTLINQCVCIASTLEMSRRQQQFKNVYHANISRLAAVSNDDVMVPTIEQLDKHY